MPKENNKMPKENNKMQVDIDTLKKQNVNDLLSIKEIYSKLEELGEKITQVKYIDNTLVKKIKKEYENFKKIILDENIQVELDNKIDEFNKKLTHDIETIKSQLNNNTSNSQLDTNTYYENYLTRKIRNKEKIDIFLCGDSITAGVGSSGYNTDNGALILTDTSNHSYYEANSISNSWANLFRRFTTRLNSNNTFFNGGIGGKYVKFFLENKKSYITTNKDIIVCMLGTNDRGEYENVKEFKVGYREYLDFLNSKCNFLIVMTPTPLNADYDKQKNFTQYEGVQAVREICKEKGYFLIDNYTNIYEMVYLKNLREEDIMSDSAHPNDKGYALIWENIKSSLGLYDEFTLYEINTDKPIIYAKYGQYTINTLPSEFPKGSIIYSLVTNTDATKQGYPGGRGGLLITDTTSMNTDYYYQYYHLQGKNKIYKRAVKILDEWNVFEEFSPTKINDNNYTTNSSVPKTNIPLNQIIYNTVSTTTGLPMTRAGFMETILPHATSSQYGQQKYYPYGRNYTFARGVNGSGNGWFAWKQETHNTSLQTFTQEVGSIPANSSIDVDLTITGGIDNNFMNLLTIESNLKTGITYCTFKKSATIYTVRFSNLTSSPIDVGQVIMRFTTLEVVAF